MPDRFGMSAHMKRCLGALTPTMFDRGGVLELERGPRGGLLGASVGEPFNLKFSANTIRTMIKRGYIDRNGALTQEGEAVWLGAKFDDMKAAG